MGPAIERDGVLGDVFICVPLSVRSTSSSTVVDKKYIPSHSYRQEIHPVALLPLACSPILAILYTSENPPIPITYPEYIPSRAATPSFWRPAAGRQILGLQGKIPKAVAVNQHNC